MKSKQLTVAFAFVTIALAVFAAGYGFGRLSTSKQVPTGANLISSVNLSLWDSMWSTTAITHIDWGTILPTQTKEAQIWIQNDAAISLSIDVSTINWTPAWAEGNMTFTYGQTNAGNPTPWSDYGWGEYPVLYAGKRAPLYFSLTASANASTGSLGFTIVITGTSL